MQYVYWIRYLEHTNPYTEGYIGITANPEKRFKYHKAGINGDNPILYRALLKGAVIEILHTFENRELCLLKEEEYRPDKNIGWNIIPGGVAPPDQTGRVFDGENHGMRNKKHSEKTKRVMSEMRKNLKWFNNGDRNIRAANCPDGFVSGRLPYEYELSEEGKKNLGKSGKKVSTPYGIFNTIKEASKHLDMSWEQVSWRVKSKKYVDWFKL